MRPEYARRLAELLTKAHKSGKLKETAQLMKSLFEEKQRETKYIRNLNTTVYVSNKFRQGAGGEDRPKLKLTISLTPGKTLELYRLVSDESESDKFAANIKVEIERLLADFDKNIDSLKTKYGLKVDDQTEEPTTTTKIPTPDEDPVVKSADSSAQNNTSKSNTPPQKKTVPAAPSKPVQNKPVQNKPTQPVKQNPVKKDKI